VIDIQNCVGFSDKCLDNVLLLREEMAILHVIQAVANRLRNDHTHSDHLSEAMHLHSTVHLQSTSRALRNMRTFIERCRSALQIANHELKS
jgi:hypothetical protein